MEDGALSACKVGAPVSESLNANVSRYPPSVWDLRKTNFPLHSTFLLKRLERTFHNPIALLNEPRDNIVHLAASIIFIHDRLVLVYDQCDTLKESR